MSRDFMVIAGPCSVESKEQVEEIAAFLKSSQNVQIMRAGAFKPRTNPDSFQGLGQKGLEILSEVKEKYNFKIISEFLDVRTKDLFFDVDIIQIGARNMQNFPLLIEAAKLNKPVLLKRGFGNTIEELLASAKYLEKYGCPEIILCERGIRSFEGALRFTLDLGAVSVLKEQTNYKVLVDPSHATGNHKHVANLALAAKACGADGIMVEVHNNPAQALCDNKQQLNFEEFNQLLENLEKINL